MIENKWGVEPFPEAPKVQQITELNDKSEVLEFDVVKTTECIVPPARLSLNDAEIQEDCHFVSTSSTPTALASVKYLFPCYLLLIITNLMIEKISEYS